VTVTAIGFGPGTNCARHIGAARRARTTQEKSRNFHGATFLGWRLRRRHLLTVTIVRRRATRFALQYGVNRNCRRANPGNRPLSRARRRWNASHQAADAASSLLSASNTKSSRASTTGPSSPTAAWDNQCSAPLSNPFFRPEEKHVVSGENNVVPPFVRGNKAIKKPAAGQRTFQPNLQNERFTRLLAAGMNLPRAMHGMPNESQAQLAKYFLSSTITTCWVLRPKMAEPCELKLHPVPTLTLAERVV